MSETLDPEPLATLDELLATGEVDELVQTFLDGMVERLADLERALVEGDRVGAHRAVHTLASGAASLGAMRVRKLAEGLELELLHALPARSGTRATELAHACQAARAALIAARAGRVG